ncbi:MULTISPECIES: formimidoylglutamate deiminase [Sphingobium]|jgi:formimidoylglutamate deiminase|uniref:formimidoylglutamate deiminase n=1 Tax=Sphingobium TaxID=165695 RepID=UPI0010F98DB3|nr:formimidoylglutamate deiminase [Sphingobium sp. RSMS]UXC93254.1 formimidoylglutamate deiminase [Sphingobium sp. RSMS]
MALWFEQALLPEGWRPSVRMILKGRFIDRIVHGIPPEPGDERHGPAFAGLPNVHSHAFQRAMAGLTERAGEGGDSFWTWREAMYRFLDRLNPEGLRAIAALAYAEMLESGFTSVGEFHYLHHDPSGAPYANPAAMAEAIAEAADDTGIALTLLPVFYAHSNFGGVPPTEGQRRFLHTPDSYARLLEALKPLNATLGVAPHSLRAVTPQELAAITALTPDGPIHIHIAEQRAEVEACLAWSNQRPVEWLMNHAEVDQRWCLIHATHIADSERNAIAKSAAGVGLCPITEANLGDGLFPARAFLAQGGRIGIGSDSNIRIDAAAELCLLEYGQRLTHQARNLLTAPGQSTGASLYHHARKGAQALGHPPATLTPGARADIVTLRPGQPTTAARSGDRLLDSWIFARAQIDSVWCAGVRRVTAGLHHARPAIEARYTQLLKALLD